MRQTRGQVGEPWRRVIRSTAPIRICDNGGWTDTWFAQRGAVFNIAVTPGVEVGVVVSPRVDDEAQVVLHAVDYGDRYGFTPGESLEARDAGGRHPLLEAAVAELPPPDDVALEITVRSGVPAGSSTGTSAAVSVALLGALDALTPGRLSARDIAALAHRVETERLGLQSGIQDQLCAAYGGINFIEMDAYPHASVTQLVLPDATWQELGRRLLLIDLGRAHDSSAVHLTVVAELAHEGPNAPRLVQLREMAARSRDALRAADLDALGRAMVENTELQRALHPGLISDDARTLIDVARERGASGWKVNGAGGAGGTVTLLCAGTPGAADVMRQALAQQCPRLRPIPITLSRHGLCVSESAAGYPG